MMYFSRVRLKPDASDRRPFWRLIQNSYEVHTLIWDLFGDDPDQERDFLFRIEYNENLPSFIVVSNREPVNRYGVWNVDSKNYDPKIVSGQRLFFSLRANPVRTKRDDKGKQKRHDVVMETKTLQKLKGIPEDQRRSLPEIVKMAGYAWLAIRAESHGFVVVQHEVHADGYRQHEFLKSKGKKSVKFSTIEYSGILTVTDPVLFVESLMKGIGPAKGFGCGLLLVKPAGDDSYAS